MKNTKQSRLPHNNGTVDPEPLIALTMRSTLGATLNRSQEAMPHLKHEYRTEANLAIHNYDRISREDAVKLRLVERALSMEIISLDRHHKAVVGALQRVQRVQWLGKKTVETRGLRPSSSSTNSVGDAVRSEQLKANIGVTHLQDHLKHVEVTLQGLATSKTMLGSAIAAAEKPFQLAAQTFSSTQPSTRDTTAGAEVLDAQQRQASSIIQRSEGKQLIAAVEEVLKKAMSDASCTMQQSIVESSRSYCSLKSASMASKTSANSAVRSSMTADLARALNAAPAEGKFETVAQRLHRPMVQAHVTGLTSNHAITIPEASRNAFNTFTLSLHNATDDLANLSFQSVKLERMATDARHDAEYEKGVLRLRRRCDPAKRV